MADFGESSPLESAKFHNNEDLLLYHNKYPEQWIKLVREAADEYFGDKSREFVFFNRAGFSKTPGFARLLWAGD